MDRDPEPLNLPATTVNYGLLPASYLLSVVSVGLFAEAQSYVAHLSLDGHAFKLGSY